MTSYILCQYYLRIPLQLSGDQRVIGVQLDALSYGQCWIGSVNIGLVQPPVVYILDMPS